MNSSVQFGYNKKAALAGAASAFSLSAGFLSGWLGRGALGKGVSEAGDILVKNAELKAEQDWNAYLTGGPGEATIPNWRVSADSPESFNDPKWSSLDPKTTKIVYQTNAGGPQSGGYRWDWQVLGTIDIPTGTAKDMHGKIRGKFDPAMPNSVQDENGKPQFHFTTMHDGSVVTLPSNGAFVIPTINLANTTSARTKLPVSTGAEVIYGVPEPIQEDWAKLLPTYLNLSEPVNYTIPSASQKMVTQPLRKQRLPLGSIELKQDVLYDEMPESNLTDKLIASRGPAVLRERAILSQEGEGNNQVLSSRTQANSDSETKNPFSSATNSPRGENKTTRRLSPVERRAQKN